MSSQKQFKTSRWCSNISDFWTNVVSVVEQLFPKKRTCPRFDSMVLLKTWLPSVSLNVCFNSRIWLGILLRKLKFVFYLSRTITVNSKFSFLSIHFLRLGFLRQCFSCPALWWFFYQQYFFEESFYLRSSTCWLK